MDQKSLIKYGALVAAALLVVYLAKQSTTMVGSRATMPTDAFDGDNKVHYVVYQSPNGDIFLRAVVQRPTPALVAFMTVLHEQDMTHVKAVDVVFKGTTLMGKTVVTGLKNIQPQKPFKGSPWREYIALKTRMSHASGDDAILIFEWVSFDFKMHFPPSASLADKRTIIDRTKDNVFIYFAEQKAFDRTTRIAHSSVLN
jgi:hypothetical protein